MVSAKLFPFSHSLPTKEETMRFGGVMLNLSGINPSQYPVVTYKELQDIDLGI